MQAAWRMRVWGIALLALIGLYDVVPAQVADPAANNGRVEGKVVGPLGEPMIGVAVWAAEWPSLDTVIARSQTDGNGVFVLGRLPLASVSLFATSKGHTVAWTTARLTSERPVAGERLRLWPANAVRGRVVDGKGLPIAGAVVLGTKDFTALDGRFRSPETVTDADGRFELRGVAIGDQVVRAWADGFVMCERALFATEDHEIEIKLERGPGVRVTIQADGVLEEQAPNVRVWLYPTRSGSGFAFPRAIEYDGRLDAKGHWAIAGLPDCDWSVQLRSPDYTFDPRRVRCKSGVDLHDLKFAATRNGSLKLHGELRTASGQVLAGERLVCRTQRSQSMSGGTPGLATTDAQGRFRMDAPLVEGEPYSLHLSRSRWVLQQTKVKGHTGMRDERYLVRYEDKAEPSRALSLVAVAAAFVGATVVNDDGSPAPFLSCSLQVQDGNNWSDMAYGTSRRDGSVVFPGVHSLDANLRVEVDQPVGAAYSESFRADASSPGKVTVQVPRAGKIHGRLLDPKGLPVVGARLMMQNYYVDTGKQIDGSWTRVMTDRKGRYAFVGVSPTGHKVHVLDKQGDRQFSTEILAVAEGEAVQKDIHMPK